MQSTIHDILRHKGNVVINVRAEASVFDLVQLLIEHNVGAVLVMNGEKLVGLVSERDVARNFVLQGKDEQATTVAEIMTQELVCVSPDMTVQ